MTKRVPKIAETFLGIWGCDPGARPHPYVIVDVDQHAGAFGSGDFNPTYLAGQVSYRSTA